MKTTPLTIVYDTISMDDGEIAYLLNEGSVVYSEWGHIPNAYKDCVENYKDCVEKIEKLRLAAKLYDAALRLAHPEGAEDEVFELWKNARTARNESE